MKCLSFSLFNYKSLLESSDFCNLSIVVIFLKLSAVNLIIHVCLYWIINFFFWSQKSCPGHSLLTLLNSNCPVIWVYPLNQNHSPLTVRTQTENSIKSLVYSLTISLKEKLNLKKIYNIPVNDRYQISLLA